MPQAQWKLQKLMKNPKKKGSKTWYQIIFEMLKTHIPCPGCLKKVKKKKKKKTSGLVIFHFN